MQMWVIREMDPSSPGSRGGILFKPHEVPSSGSSLVEPTIGHQQIPMIPDCLTVRICLFRKYHKSNIPFTWKKLLK